MILLSRVGLSVLTICAALLSGCSQMRPPANATTSELILALQSEDRSIYQHACERLFERGLDAVPALLDAAENSEPVHFSAPTFPYRSRRPATVTSGQVCLYLVEGIRKGHLAHSVSETFECGDEGTSSLRCAQSEYRQWYESSQRTGEPPYEPRVRWSWIDDDSVTRFVSKYGKQPEPEYLSVVRLNKP